MKEKVKKNKSMLTKADKGNTMVIMAKKEYINKAEEFIKKKGPYEEVKYIRLHIIYLFTQINTRRKLRK